MRVSIWNLYDWLDEQDIEVEADVSSQYALFGGARILEEEAAGELNSDCVYLSDAPAAHGWGDEYSAVYLCGVDSVAVKGLSLTQAVNQAMACMDFYSTWENRLQAAMVAANPLQEMLDVTAAVLPYPMMVGNIGAKALAVSKWEQPVADPTFIDIRDKGYIPLDNVRFLSGRTDTNAIYSSRRAHTLKRTIDGQELEILRSNLWVNNNRVGTMGVYDAGGGFRKGDLRTLEIFVTYAERCMALHGDRYLSESILGDFLAEALESGRLDEERLGEILNDLGWGVGDRYLFMRLELVNRHQATAYLKRTAESIQARITECCAFGTEAGINILFNYRQKGGDTPLSKISHILDSEDFVIGISYPFNDLTQFAGYYHQAHQATNYGKYVGLSSPVYASTIAVGEISKMAKTNENISRMIHSDIVQLVKYDKSYNTEYAYTLFHYLVSGCHFTDAANRLGVHRNTMKYRVAKIEELLTLDIFNENDRNLLLLSCMLYGVPYKK